MKQLILIRHAKSSWEDPGLPDILRPLNKRGRRDAPMMGERLAKRDVQPDLVITSPARRAIETAEAIVEEIEYLWEEIVEDERLYDGDMDDLLEVLQELEEGIDCVLIFGHNPGLTEFVDDLYPIGNIPTCGVVTFEFDVESWEEIEEVEPVAFDFDYPKRIQ